MPIYVKGSVGFATNVTTATTEVLAANANRTYAVFINDTDAVIYLNFGAAAVANSGVRLNASGGSYEMSKEAGNLSTAVAYGIHAGSGNKVCCGAESSL